MAYLDNRLSRITDELTGKAVIYNPYATQYGLLFFPPDVPIYSGNMTKAQYARNGIMNSNHYNTYQCEKNQWLLFPMERLEVEPPTAEIKLVDVPGSYYPLDLTTSLTGSPGYSTRTGGFHFRIVADRRKWDGIYSDIANKLHGQRFNMVRMEEPDYYYSGRIEVISTKSERKTGQVTLKGTFEPFKYKVQSTGEDWLWDTFSFEHGYIYDLKNMVIPAYDAQDPDTEIEIELHDVDMPVCPTFTVVLGTGASKVILTISGETTTTYDLNDGENIDPTLTFAEHGNKTFTLKSIGGSSTVTVDYRGGSL